MRAVKVIAWLNLIGNLVLVISGGIVRLTDSGLGCTFGAFACTPDQFFAQNLHAYIEQGNRGLGVILGLLAAAAVLAVWRMRHARPDLWVHAWILLVGVAVEGAVGGVAVVTGLNAWIVGTHYLLSSILVGVATSFIIRSRRPLTAREPAIVPWMRILTHVTTFLLAGSVVLGVFTTGSGPHSGDPNVLRDTLLWEPFVHVHSWFGYAIAAALVLLLIGGIVRRERRFTGAVIAVIAVVVVQIAVGLLQANIGLPPLLVGIHMVLAAITIALMVLLMDATKAPALAGSAHPDQAGHPDEAALHTAPSA